MTTWDERAMEQANLFYPPPPDGEMGLTYPLEALRDGKRDAFMLGASWQQKQLLTDDVIERAAMAILLRNYPGCTLDEARRFAGAGEREDARNDARVALTAALGGPE